MRRTRRQKRGKARVYGKFPTWKDLGRKARTFLVQPIVRTKRMVFDKRRLLAASIPLREKERKVSFRRKHYPSYGCPRHTRTFVLSVASGGSTQNGSGLALANSRPSDTNDPKFDRGVWRPSVDRYTSAPKVKPRYGTRLLDTMLVPETHAHVFCSPNKRDEQGGYARYVPQHELEPPQPTRYRGLDVPIRHHPSCHRGRS